MKKNHISIEFITLKICNIRLNFFYIQNSKKKTLKEKIRNKQKAILDHTNKMLQITIRKRKMYTEKEFVV